MCTVINFCIRSMKMSLAGRRTFIISSIRIHFEEASGFCRVA